MIRYRQVSPSARVRHLVHSFWTLEHDGLEPEPQRIVPDGRTELILNWGQPFRALHGSEWRPQPRSFLAGQIDGPLMLRPGGPARMLGIGLHPHAAARIFRQPMGELAKLFTPVDDLSIPLSRHLEQALNSTVPIAAVEQALLAAAGTSRPDQVIESALRCISASHGAVDIGRMSRDLGISLRQFERRFQSVVGLTPKLFCRVQRFNQVCGLLKQPSANWAEAAVACGFYDQAHLIRECRKLAGTVPTRLLTEDAGLARHFYRRSSMSLPYKTAAGSVD